MYVNGCGFVPGSVHDTLFQPKWGVELILEQNKPRDRSMGNFGDIDLHGGVATETLRIVNKGFNRVWLSKIVGVKPPFVLELKTELRLPIVVLPRNYEEVGTISCKGTLFFGSAGVQTTAIVCCFESERIGNPFEYSVQRMKLGLRLTACGVDNSSMYRSILNPVAKEFVPFRQQIIENTPAKFCYYSDGYPIVFKRSQILDRNSVEVVHCMHLQNWHKLLKEELTEQRKYISRFTIYDVEIQGSYFGKNSRSLLIHCPRIFEEDNNIISLGDLVYIRNDNFNYIVELRCIIIEKLRNKNSIRVKLPGSIHPVSRRQYTRSGVRFQIRFEVSEADYVSKEVALVKIDACERSKQQLYITGSDFIDVIKIPSQNIPIYWQDNSLNDEQKLAVRQVLSGDNSHPFFVFGPPGTGKTVTAIELLLQITIKERASSPVILGCAPSDAAADILAHRLALFLNRKEANEAFELIRLNYPSREFSHVSYRDTVLKYCVVDSTTGLFIMPSPSDLNKRTRPLVIISTCTASALLNDNLKPDYIIVDESAQASEPEVLIPISLGSPDAQIILCGDPRQLGPKTHVPAFAQTLDSRIEHIFKRNINLRIQYRTRLIKNYRSQPQILNIFSRIFYKNQLTVNVPEAAGDYVRKWRGSSVLFISHTGEQLKEYEIINETIQSIEESVGTRSHLDIACIAPDRDEAIGLRKILREKGLGQTQVGSIHDYQGQEKDVVVFSTCKIKHDDRALNVALSRAKHLLVVVGNPYYLAYTSRTWFKVFELMPLWEGKPFTFPLCLKHIKQIN